MKARPREFRRARRMNFKRYLKAMRAAMAPAGSRTTQSRPVSPISLGSEMISPPVPLAAGGTGIEVLDGAVDQPLGREGGIVDHRIRPSNRPELWPRRIFHAALPESHPCREG